MHLQKIEMLHLLWLVPVLAALLWYAARRRRTALRLLLGSRWKEQTPEFLRGTRRTWKAAAFLLALILLVAALTRPAWNPVETMVDRQGRDRAPPPPRQSPKR